MTVQLAEPEVEACLTALRRLQDDLSGVVMRTRNCAEDYEATRERFKTRLRAVDRAVQALEAVS